MEIENEFTVPAPIDHVWAYLLDVERVAPCMPGAELTEVVDDHTWKGKVNMKLGPVSLVVRRHGHDAGPRRPGQARSCSPPRAWSRRGRAPPTPR